jgi:hypothetical protein
VAGYFGMKLEQLARRDYTHTQQVSAQVPRCSEATASRCSTGCSIHRATTIPPRASLFERAGAKVSGIEDIDLVDHVDWPHFVATYRIGVAPDPGPVEADDDSPV